MPRSSLTRVLALAVALLTPLAAQPTLAQTREVLGQISSDAHAALILPNLARSNDRLAKLNKRLGLDAPHLDDLLTHFKREAGMTGVNDRGTLLLVVQDLDQSLETQTPPTLLALVPVSDYALFVKGYGGDPEQDITPLTRTNHTGYARRLGSHALLGKDRDALANYSPLGDASQVIGNLGDAGRRHLGRADAALYLNVEGLRPALSANLDELERKMRDAFAMAGAAEGTALPQRIAELFTTGARHGLNDTTGMMISLELDDHGIALNHTLRYQPGSALAALFHRSQTPTGPELARLPDEPFIFAMAMDTQAFATATLLRRTLNALGGGADAEPLATMLRDALPLVEQTRATASVQYVPTQDSLMSGNPFPGVTLYATGDPEQYRQQIKAYFNSLDGLALPAGNGQGGTITASYTEAALRVEGIEVDQYAYQADIGDTAGNTGQTQGYVAAMDQHVVVTTRRDLQLIRNALDAVQREEGIGSEAAAKQTDDQSRGDRRSQRRTNRGGPAEPPMPPEMRGRRGGQTPWQALMPEADEDEPTTIPELRPIALPDDAMLEGYLSIAGVIETAQLMLPMLDDTETEIPADLPPVVISAAIEGDSLAGRLYIPHRTIQLAVSLGQHFGATFLGPEQPTDDASRAETNRPPRY
ncbi:MAG: hypothetical protein ACOC71_04045 [Hyphomicrobiales bacterium]